MDDTLSNATGEAAGPVARSIAHLFRVIGVHAPGEPPSRHVLADVEVVEIGRANRTGHLRDGARLRLDLADSWASVEHARLTRGAGGWYVEDLESKNGTLVSGVKATRTYLQDGDVIEIGRTFFAFASAMMWPAGTPADDGAVEPLPGIATLLPGLAAALGRAAAIARGLTPVLIEGPTGVGKEVVARGVHAASARPGAFVPVNCAAIPRELVESTLFGHRRGAFSGAIDDEPGLVRGADRGTLFLDELGDLPLPAQAVLLRVLQEREVTGVGATRAVPVDLRVVAATHRDLRAMVAAGTFRADLLHRLRGFAVELPALAARRADLGLLIPALLARHAPGRRVTLHPRAARVLLAHDWPGNVRELELVLGAALSLAAGDTIAAEDLPAELNAVAPTADGDPERDRLRALLEEHHGNVRAIARALDKDPVQIRRWLRRYGLDAAAFR